MRMHNPPHPGSVLLDYLGSVSITHAARHLGITRAALPRILNGSAGISADMALTLPDALARISLQDPGPPADRRGTRGGTVNNSS